MPEAASGPFPHPLLPFGAEIDDDGVWCQVLNRVAVGEGRPALFLDRDGVVVEEVHYLHRVEDTRLIDGAAGIIERANLRDIPVVIVTNQAGIGYGKYGWSEFIAVQEKIMDDLAELGAFVNAVYACPFHAKGVPPYRADDHACRKPNPGMLLKAAASLPLDMAASWIVGDRGGDIGAGSNAGLAGGMHVLSGHGNDEGERRSAKSYADSEFQVVFGDTIAVSKMKIPLLG